MSHLQSRLELLVSLNILGVYPHTPVLAKYEFLLQIFRVSQETSQLNAFLLKRKHFDDKAHRGSPTRIESTALLSFRPLNRRINWRWWA